MSENDSPYESDGHKVERGLYAVAAAIERFAVAAEFIADTLKEQLQIDLNLASKAELARMQFIHEDEFEEETKQ